MIHIAILTGGPSSEREISVKSADCIAAHLDSAKYTYRYLLMESDGWYERTTRSRIDLNDFTLEIDGKKEHFDFVFLMIHGTPAEDGKIQGYFEYLGIPHSTCETLSASLTFNKQKCKDYLKAYQIPMAESMLLEPGDPIDEPDILSLGLPLFVKPNNNGSSYGISKVKSREELLGAITHARDFDDEIIIEAFLDGREFGCGVVREDEVLHALPITEIIPEAEFFTYEAKYEGASQEITPAEISEDLTAQCQELSKRLYRLLSCRGMVRFDFILVGDTFFLLEANTIPGMSEASIVPQQAVAYGWTISKLLDVVVEDCLALKVQ